LPGPTPALFVVFLPFPGNLLPFRPAHPATALPDSQQLPDEEQHCVRGDDSESHTGVRGPVETRENSLPRQKQQVLVSEYFCPGGVVFE